jgi:hypothetical protein
MAEFLKLSTAERLDALKGGCGFMSHMVTLEAFAFQLHLLKPVRDGRT